MIEDQVVPTCEELGLSQIVWSPVAQGVLTGKYLPGQAPPPGSRATDDKGGATMISRYLRDDLLAAVQNLRPIAEDLGITMAQLAVAWVLQNPNVAAAIVGASKPEQIGPAAEMSGMKLDDDVMARIDAALEGFIERDPAKTSSPPERLC